MPQKGVRSTCDHGGEDSLQYSHCQADACVHAGIGLFLAFIGLQSQEGLGIISYDAGTLLALGGCPAKSQASRADALFAS